MKADHYPIKWAYIKATEDELEISEGRNYELVLVSFGGHVQRSFFTSGTKALEMKKYYQDRGYINVYS